MRCLWRNLCQHLQPAASREEHAQSDEPNLRSSCQVPGHCDHFFRVVARLKKHLAARHSGPVLDCGACLFTCKSLAALKRHRQMVHRGAKLWKCKLCTKTFGHHKGLEQHTRGVHAGVTTTFSCTRCGKGYRRRACVERHKRG